MRLQCQHCVLIYESDRNRLFSSHFFTADIIIYFNPPETHKFKGLLGPMHVELRFGSVFT
jgi:hypothetical protein